jgi:5-methylcytosine-specific restriction endonuclease McrA
MGRRLEKPRNNKTMTESAFFSWLRSSLRRTYMRGWKPANEVAKDNRRAITKGRLKWEYQCKSCKDWFLRKDVQVDHIIECGTLKTFEDLSLFSERLFVEKDGLQILCTECHNRKTHDYKTD